MCRLHMRCFHSMLIFEEFSTVNSTCVSTEKLVCMELHLPKNLFEFPSNAMKNTLVPEEPFGSHGKLIRAAYTCKLCSTTKIYINT